MVLGCFCPSELLDEKKPNLAKFKFLNILLKWCILLKSKRNYIEHALRVINNIRSKEITTYIIIFLNNTIIEYIFVFCLFHWYSICISIQEERDISIENKLLKN